MTHLEILIEKLDDKGMAIFNYSYGYEDDVDSWYYIGDIEDQKQGDRKECRVIESDTHPKIFSELVRSDKLERVWVVKKPNSGIEQVVLKKLTQKDVLKVLAELADDAQWYTDGGDRVHAMQLINDTLSSLVNGDLEGAIELLKNNEKSYFFNSIESMIKNFDARREYER